VCKLCLSWCRVARVHLELADLECLITEKYLSPAGNGNTVIPPIACSYTDLAEENEYYCTLWIGFIWLRM
jgi:hypothetical protein